MKVQDRNTEVEKEMLAHGLFWGPKDENFTHAYSTSPNQCHWNVAIHS